MRILVISDIHANLTAFETVLDHSAGEWDKVWFLGDLVGYGPDPNECIARLQALDPVALSGNHDWAVLGRIDIKTFNRDARRAIEWTRSAISPEGLAYLESLPPKIPGEQFTLAHASPRHPVWEYILDQATAAVNFTYFESPYCLVGHTHTPVIYEQVENLRVAVHSPRYDQSVGLNGARLIINPGSVGQPRDSDPRASYALLNTETLGWEYRRVPYDVEAVQARMRDLRLPERLITRLSFGW